MVEPVNPFAFGILDSFEAAPWPAPLDHLSFVEIADRLGQGIVLAVAAAAEQRFDPGLGEPFGLLDRYVL